MSSNHTKTMLKTLKEYRNCEISLTFSNNGGTPLLFVSYQNNSYQITYFKSLTTETYNSIESTILAVDKAMQPDLRETSN